MDDENFFQQIIAEAPDGILYSDAKGIITLWNKGCERIFGFVAAEALGQSLDIIIPDALRQRHWQGYDETIRTGSHTLRRRRSSGRTGAPQGWCAHLR